MAISLREVPLRERRLLGEAVGRRPNRRIGPHPSIPNDP